MIRKGIILAGGTGSRMSPITKSVNKQLLPLYDKPLFFYPLSVLMLAKIKDILIIVNKGQVEQFKKVLPNGKNIGVKITLWRWLLKLLGVIKYKAKGIEIKTTSNNKGITLLALCTQNKKISKLFSLFNMTWVIKYPLRTKKISMHIIAPWK